MLLKTRIQAFQFHGTNNPYPLTGATGTTIGTGSTNTTAIIAAIGGKEKKYAAGIARAYNGGGFDDWFLPSKLELGMMRGKMEIINTTAAANGGKDFVPRRLLLEFVGGQSSKSVA